MYEVRFTGRRRDGQPFTGELTTTRTPLAWTAEDAKLVLWGLIRQLDAHGVYRADLRQGSSPVDWIVEVEADSGKIVTQPMVLSNEAVVWLEKCQFTLPGSRGVQ
jgi:hypothetical protein